MVKVEKAKGLLNPPGWLLLAAGVIAGLAHGLLTLSSSADAAVAVGLAWAIGIGVGGWLGLTVAGWLRSRFLSIYNRQRATADTAIALAKSRYAALPTMLKAVDATPSGNGYTRTAAAKLPRYVRPGRFLWRRSWDFYPFGIFVVFGYGLTVALFYVGGIAIAVPAILWGLATGVTFVAMLFAWVFPLALNRKVLNISRQLLRAIGHIEQQSAEARVEDITLSIPDLSSIEKTIDTPSKLLTRLAA